MMVRVRMNKVASSPEGVHVVGDVVEVRPAVARDWVSQGAAEYVDRQPETATAEPVAERAVVKRPRKRKVKKA